MNRESVVFCAFPDAVSITVDLSPRYGGEFTRKHPLFYAFTRIFRRAFKFFCVLGHNTDRINISNSARKRYIELDTTIRET